MYNKKVQKGIFNKNHFKLEDTSDRSSCCIYFSCERLFRRHFRQPCQLNYFEHAFGDSKKPLWESVLYVEKILRQQMNLVLTKAADVAIRRGGNSICPEDLLFLLRKNKVKLKRLLMYLSIKDAKDVISKPNSADVAEVVRSPARGKRVKHCLEFLNKIDNTFMYSRIMEADIPDTVVTKRNARRYDMVCAMSDEEYFEFTKTLQASFCRSTKTQGKSEYGDTEVSKRGGEKFLEWLMEDGVTNFVPTHFAIEIINYLARETIAEIVDLVMLIREEKDSEHKSISSPYAEITRKSDESERTRFEISSPKCNEEYSMKAKDDFLEDYESNAITVAEINEVIQRFAKNTTEQNFLQKDYSAAQLPGHLLCC